MRTINETRRGRLIDSLIETPRAGRDQEPWWRVGMGFQIFVIGMAAGVVASIIVIALSK